MHSQARKIHWNANFCRIKIVQCGKTAAVHGIQRPSGSNDEKDSQLSATDKMGHNLI